jgi:hypothetical protein
VDGIIQVTPRSTELAVCSVPVPFPAAVFHLLCDHRSFEVRPFFVLMYIRRTVGENTWPAM